MCSADARIGCIVKRNIFHSAPDQVRNPLLRLSAQLFDFAKLDGLRRTCLRTCRLQSHLLPVITKCAFESAAIIGISFYHSERTRNHTISAAVADVWLNEHSPEFRANDRSRRTRFEAACIFTMLANVRR